MIYFAKEIQREFREDLSVEVAEDKLQKIIEKLASPLQVSDLMDDFNKMSINYQPFVVIVNTLIGFESMTSGFFQKYVKEYLDCIHPEYYMNEKLIMDGEVFGSIVSGYKGNQSVIDKIVGFNVEEYEHKVIRTYLFDFRAVSYDSLFDYLRKMLIHLSMVRFFFYMSPGVVDSIKEKSPDDITNSDICLLKENYIKAVYLTGKFFMHQTKKNSKFIQSSIRRAGV